MGSGLRGLSVGSSSSDHVVSRRLEGKKWSRSEPRGGKGRSESYKERQFEQRWLCLPLPSSPSVLRREGSARKRAEFMGR